MTFPLVGWNEQWKMETGRKTGERDHCGRRETVEQKHLDLVVHFGPRNRKPFVL
jgi:hypothetical protein